MANTLRPYLDCIRHTLTAAMCLRNFPSQQGKLTGCCHIVFFFFFLFSVFLFLGINSRLIHFFLPLSLFPPSIFNHPLLKLCSGN
jgi:hypothetical protein